MFDAFRQAVKERAKEVGYTYAKIAEIAGIDEGTIKQFMCAANDSRRIAEKLADALGMAILYRDGEFYVAGNPDSCGKARFTPHFKKIREQKGIKQSDVAQVLGITKQAYSDYELGKREAGYAVLIRLADFFGVSIDDLIRSSNLQELFFDNVCYFLRCKGLTVTILTNELGIERKTFYNWRDKGDLPLSKALLIADFLGIPLSELLKGN